MVLTMREYILILCTLLLSRYSDLKIQIKISENVSLNILEISYSVLSYRENCIYFWVVNFRLMSERR